MWHSQLHTDVIAAAVSEPEANELTRKLSNRENNAFFFETQRIVVMHERKN